MIPWIALPVVVVTALGASRIMTVRRPIRIDQLGSVSHHWIAEHVDQRS
jgi:hypothetical protein